MSEAYHQWLNNLTWWEQIDRFFNPSKYSCSTYALDDTVWHCCLISVALVFICGFILLWLSRKYSIHIDVVEKSECKS